MVIQCSSGLFSGAVESIYVIVGNLLYGNVPIDCVCTRTGWFWSTSGLSCVPDETHYRSPD